MKRQTIPRTELLGNLLFVRLMESVKTALQGYVTISENLYFTDSQECLTWIKAKDKEFNRFVQNRVEDDIREKSNTDDWYYCPTACNPADLISKQIKRPMDAIFSNWWLVGPQALPNQAETNIN